MNASMKTKSKRLLSMLLALMMCLTMLPTVVFAEAETLTVKIGETTLVNGMYYTVSGDTIQACESEPSGETGYACLNGSTLTLKNFEYTSTQSSAINIKGDCTINMVGTSTVTGNSSNANKAVYGIFCNKKLTFKSDSDGALTANGGSVTYCDGATGNVSSTCGVRADDNIVVLSGTLNASGGQANVNNGFSYGLFVTYVTVEDGKVTATGNKAAYTRNDVRIINERKC